MLRVLSLLVSFSALSADITVTAEKIDNNNEKTSSVISLIGEDEIISSQKSEVVDLLSSIDGVVVNKSGNTATLFLRGSNSNHTLILIDGVPINDPTSPENSIDLGLLNSNNIEKIEVLKGPQSVLYGSHAIGGVVSIKTKRAKESKTILGLNYGKYNHAQVRLNNSIKNGPYNIDFSSFYKTIEGPSQFSEDLFKNPEEDKLTQLGLSLKVGQMLSSGGDIEALASYTHSRNQIDGFDNTFSYADQSGNEVIEEKFNGKFTFSEYFLREDIKSKFTLLNHNIHYSNINSNAPDRYLKNGDTSKILLENNFYANERNTFYFGIEGEKTTFNSSYFSTTTSSNVANYDTTNVSPHVSHKYFKDNYSILYGLRYLNSSYYRNVLVYQATPRLYLTDQFEIHFSHSIGVKDPSLYQVYTNRNSEELRSEQSTNSEVGVHFHQKGFIKISSTLFNSALTDLIAYDSTNSRYVNQESANILGVENNFKFKFTDKIFSSLSYTYLDTEDNLTKRQLAQRPTHLASLKLFYDNEGWHNEVEVYYKGDRTGNHLISGSTIRYPSYVIANFNTQYTFKDDYKLGLLVNNILGREYFDVHGYSTANQEFIFNFQASL